MSKACAKILLLAVGAALLAPSAQATVTVVPLNKGGVATDNVVYYAGAVGTPTGFIFDGNSPQYPAQFPYPFGATDVTQGQVKEAGTLANVISFDVYSDKVLTLQTGQSLGVVVTTLNFAGSTAIKMIPIAGSGIPNNSDTPCTSGGCTNAGFTGAGSTDISNSTSYFFLANYTSQTHIRIDIYPRDLCTSYAAQQSGSVGSGCVADTSDPRYQTAAVGPSAGNLALTFDVVLLTNNVLAANPPSSTEIQDSASLSVHFEDNARAVSCPGGVISYFPGDGQIFADTSGFVLPASGYAPLNGVIAVLKKNNAAPVVDATFLTGNDSLSRTGFGANAAIGGFTNLTSASDIADTYGVGFLVRDAAGVVTLPSGTGCVLQGVQTSVIQGFLSKSSCFIATAAFRSVDSSPVSMLRAFRDEVLFKSELGTEFVHWYYRWSPPAAEWLMKNPEFRYPVLQALIPVEITAWFMLHPMQLAILMIFSASALVLGVGFAFLMRLKGRVSE